MTTTSPRAPRRVRVLAAGLVGTLVSSLLAVPALASSGEPQPEPPAISRPFDLTRALAPNDDELDDMSMGASISDDGRYVVFETWATNVDGSILIHDVTTGATTEVVAHDLDNPFLDPVPVSGSDPVITGDGTGVAYLRGDDVHVVDRAASTIEVHNGPDELDFLDALDVSDDGETFAFYGLDSTDAEPDYWQVYVRRAGEDIVHVGAANGDGFNNQGLSVSGDGSTLVWGAPSATSGVALKMLDLTDADATAETLAELGDTGMASPPSITDDGDTVAVTAERDGSTKIIRVDTSTGEEQVLPPFEGDAYYTGFDPAISGDGSTVAFTAYPRYFEEGAIPPYNQVLVYDIASDRLLNASSSPAGEDAENGSSGPVALDDDGTVAAFESGADNLVADDANEVNDIFVAVRGELPPLSAPPAFGDADALSVIATGSTHIEIEWPAADDDVAVTAYRVYLDGSLVETANSSTTSHTFFDLEPSTEYDLSVVAVDGDNQASDPLTASQSTTAEGDGEPEPDVSTSLSATEVPSGVQLSWDPIGRSQFVVQRALGDAAFADLATVTGTSSYVDSTARAETTYRYQVLGVVDGERKSHTTVATFTTSPLTISSITTDETIVHGDVLELGSTIELGVRGSAYREALARVTFTSWYDADDDLLGAPATRTVEVELPEDESNRGRYAGSFEVEEGITGVTSITGVITDDGTHEATRAASDFPVGVAGAVSVTLTRHSDRVSGGLLTAWNGSRYNSRRLAAGSPQVLSVADGDDFEITLTDSASAVLDVVAGVDVRSGRTTALNMTPNLPATLQVRVLDDADAPVSGARVQVQDADTDAYRGWDVTGADGTADLVGFAEDQEIEVVVTTNDVAYVEEAVATHTVDAGANTVDVELALLATGTVTGIVSYDDGAPTPGPIGGASVNLSGSLADGRSVHEHVLTGDDGRFTASIPAGTFGLSVSTTRDGLFQLTPVIVTGGGTTDIGTYEITPPRPYTIDVTLRTKLAGAFGFTTQPIDWRNAVHYGLTAGRIDGGYGWWRVDSSEFTIVGQPGEVIRFCADGSEARLPRACENVTLADGELAAQIDLEQGAGITGQVVVDDAPATTFQATVYRLESGRRQAVAWSWFNGDDVEFGIVTAGSYELEISVGTRRAILPFTIAATGASTDLGTIVVPADTDRVVRGVNTSVRALQPIVMPGGSVDVRASVEAATDVVDASIVLDVPIGATVVANSIIADGELVADADDDAETVTIPVGDLADGDVVAVRVRLDLGDDLAAGDVVQLKGVLRADGGSDDLLGIARVAVTNLTIQAPRRTASLGINVSGKAPAGATVRVTAGRAVIGTATVTPGGLWSADVQLPDVGRAATYQLAAELLEDGDVTASSDPRYVSFDDAQPELTQVRLGQVPEGRTVTFDPRDGIARFPYVFVPGQPLQLALTFNDPDAVDNVVVTVTGVDAEAERDGAEWVAELMVPTVGQIAVRWDIVSSGADDTLPTDEQLENQLANGWFEATEGAIEQTDNDDGTGTIDVPLDFGDGTELDVQVVVEEAPYTPTAEDEAEVAALGAPLYGMTMDVQGDLVLGEDLVATFEAYVPASALETAIGADALLAASAKAIMTKDLAGFLNLRGRVSISASARESAKRQMNKYDIEDALGSNAKYDRIAAIIERYNKCPEMYRNGLPDNFLSAISNAAESALPAADLITGGLTIAGLKVDPGFFKGTIIWLQQVAAGKALEKGLDKTLLKYEQMLDGVTCPDLPPDDQNGDGTAGGGSTDGGSGGTVIANPETIVDPSGYVYEGMPSNRLEGVTATVTYQDAPNSVPEVWNATWYGQENPLETDGAGRYAWDVPVGFWRVHYSMDGYVDDESALLEVLPPHFDVNEGLVSYAAPTVASVSATTDAVTVEFSKPMVVSSVTAGRLTVEIGGEAVEGSVEAVDAETDPETGRSNALAFQFVPDEPFAAGSSLSIAVAQTVQSYALVGMTAAATATRNLPAAPDDDDDDGGETPPDDDDDDDDDDGGSGGSGGGSGGGSTVTVSAPAPSAPGEPVTVTVETSRGPVRITLHGATGGSVTVRLVGSSSISSGFDVVGLGFELSTTSAFTSATVCFPYDDDDVDDAGLDEDDLSLFHVTDDGAVQDVTTSVNTVTNQICGTTTSFSPFFVGEARTTRLAGADRYETAAEVSRASFPDGAPIVFVASGTVFADALSAGPAAAELGGPVLLTQPGALPAATVAEIERLAPARVVVVGGTGAVSEAVLYAIAAATDGDVRRVAGTDRYATAAAVSAFAFRSADRVFLATGAAFPDALTGGVLAAAAGAPILLTTPETLPATTAAEIARLGADTVTVLGGTGAVAKAVEHQLASFAVDRVAGTDRYATAAAVSDALGASTAYVATGESFADALTGTPAAALDGAAILLTRPQVLPAATADALTALAPSSVTVLGGIAAVSRDVELAVASTMVP